MKSKSPSLLELLEAAESDGLSQRDLTRRLERIVAEILGGPDYGPSMIRVPPEESERMGRALDNMLSTLSFAEEADIRIRHGLSKPGGVQHYSSSTTFLPPIEEGSIGQKALKKLGNLARSLTNPNNIYEWIQRFEGSVPAQGLADVTVVIEKLKQLTPALIDHLKRHEEDIGKIHWRVFEHLIAEFFASWGFHDVRLVGRNGRTSADIYAATVLNPVGFEHRYFIEVKRWKDKVGIDVINQVLGAFIGERDRYGWHAAMIVTVVGFTDFEKWTREELRMKGVELKEKEDLLRWLRDYKQNAKGLWLPEPSGAL